MMAGLSFGALRISVLPSVYEPAEDSFLLATYASSLQGKVLEMGCGSGIVSLSAASPASSVLGLDINPAAVECSRRNAESNGIKNAHFLPSDLFSEVPEGERFDSILFNPPYLPTTRGEKLALEAENAAYDGGASGLEVFSRFILQAPRHLAAGGRVAVIATSLNNGISATLEALERHIGHPQVLAQESFFFEKIALCESVLQQPIPKACALRRR